MSDLDRKIGRMHKEFGIDPSHRCGECSNCHRQRYHDRNYTKCLVYGDTASEATDWVQKWTACGMFNKPWNGPQMMKIFNSRKGLTPNYQCEGQMSLFDKGGMNGEKFQPGTGKRGCGKADIYSI